MNNHTRLSPIAVLMLLVLELVTVAVVYLTTGLHEVVAPSAMVPVVAVAVLGTLSRLVVGTLRR